MIYLCLEGLEGFVVLDGELVAVVEGFADFVFLELLFVVGRGHCVPPFSLALLMTVPLSSMSSSEKVRIFIMGSLRKTIQLDLTVATME